MDKDFKLASKSKKQWLNAVLDDIDAFLQDLADCERKSSSMAMSFVGKYPQKVEVVSGQIAIATESLGHFQQVYKVMEKRGVQLHQEMAEDLYVKQLVWQSRNGRKERFLDRLAIAAVVELRAAERLSMIAEAIKTKQFQSMFSKMAETKQAQAEAYVGMLLTYFDKAEVKERFKFFANAEAEVVGDLEIQAALH